MPRKFLSGDRYGAGLIVLQNERLYGLVEVLGTSAATPRTTSTFDYMSRDRRVYLGNPYGGWSSNKDLGYIGNHQ